MKLLSLNYAQLTSALSAQVESPAPRKYTKPYIPPTTQTTGQRINMKQNKVCYRYGEKGHFARECLAETPTKITDQDINYITVENYEQFPEQEVYVIEIRNRPRTTTTLSERTQTAQSESQKERAL